MQQEEKKWAKKFGSKALEVGKKAEKAEKEPAKDQSNMLGDMDKDTSRVSRQSDMIFKPAVGNDW